MISIRDKDAATAEQFFTEHSDIGAMIEAYPECVDPEIMQDNVALGCYLSYRLSGMDHTLAAMQACRRGPRTKGSDRGFNEHARHRMNSMTPMQLGKILKKAHKAGIKTQGKFYVGPIADRRGVADPCAWVSTTEDIRQVVVERNYEATGCVENRQSELRPLKKVPLAKDIVNELVRRRAKSDPAMRERLAKGGAHALRAVREEIVGTHGRNR